MTNAILIKLNGSQTWRILKERALNERVKELICIWFSLKKTNHFERNVKNSFFADVFEEGQ
jgi:hypothetical protein